MQPEMTEIVNLQTVDTVMWYVAVIGPILGLLVGTLLGMRRGQLAFGAKFGILIGLLGPIITGLWVLYRYMIRYDAETGYVGLHRMSVFFANIVIFVVAGAAIGAFYAHLYRRMRPDEQITNDTEQDTEP